MQNNNTPLILVTGASGFLASHLIKLLLEKGLKIRGTVRSLAKKENYEFLYNLVPEKKENLEFAEASLDEKEGWSAAVEGCEYVFHVASPIPKNTSASSEEFVQSAVNGTKYVLEASLEKGVKKVVVTSSGATITYGNPNPVITEDDYSDEKACDPYALSKVKAEKFVWEFYEQHKNEIKISVVNPFLVLGPALTKADSSSASIIGEILRGTSSGVLDLPVGIVDVRDVAETHYQAMFRDEANGKRYICSGVNGHWRDFVRILKEEFERQGFTISDRPVTKEEVAEKGRPIEKAFLPLLGIQKDIRNDRSVKELGMRYRSLRDTVIDTANSLIEVGFVSRP